MKGRVDTSMGIVTLITETLGKMKSYLDPKIHQGYRSEKGKLIIFRMNHFFFIMNDR